MSSTGTTGPATASSTTTPRCTGPSRRWTAGRRCSASSAVTCRAEVAVHDGPAVTALRLAVPAPDYDEALRFYRDVLGLQERAAYTSPGGRVTILEAGRATLELADPP